MTFVDAPTGLVYDAKRDILYVASTLDNKVFAVGDAGDTNKDRGRGTLIYSDHVNLHGPLIVAGADRNRQTERRTRLEKATARSVVCLFHCVVLSRS